MSAYKRALELEPRRPGLRLGLGRAYEGLGREKDARPLLALALEQYRQAVQLDPRDAGAHEALIAAALKSGRLEETAADYKKRIAQDPGNPHFGAALRKLEALVLLRSDAKPAPDGPGRFTRFLLKWGLLIGAAAFLVAGIAVGFQTSVPQLRPLGPALVRTGVFLALVYAVYLAWMKRL